MKKHFFYYISLIACISVAVLLVRNFAYQKQLQMSVVVGLGIVYALWGIVHHKMHHTLRTKIVLEYVVVASLGVAAILFILKSVL